MDYRDNIMSNKFVRYIANFIWNDTMNMIKTTIILTGGAK